MAAARSAKIFRNGGRGLLGDPKAVVKDNSFKYNSHYVSRNPAHK
jgi:hypothetical protein